MGLERTSDIPAGTFPTITFDLFTKNPYHHRMPIDLTDQRFGTLTSIRCVGSKRLAHGKKSVALWLCRCDCGAEVEVSTKSLRGGKRRYCDWHNHRDISRPPDPTLPQKAKRPTWACWMAMHSRCKYDAAPGWRNYGGRGITVCDRWELFDNFLADMGERPSRDHSIERLDVNGHYEPGNCVWATRAEQAANRRDTIWVEWRGERRKFIELARELGFDARAARSRLRAGWDLESAISKPINRHGPKLLGPPKPPSQSSIIRDQLKRGLSVDTIMANTGATRMMVHVVKWRMDHPRQSNKSSPH